MAAMTGTEVRAVDDAKADSEAIAQVAEVGLRGLSFVTAGWSFWLGLSILAGGQTRVSGNPAFAAAVDLGPYWFFGVVPCVIGVVTSLVQPRPLVIPPVPRHYSTGRPVADMVLDRASALEFTLRRAMIPLRAWRDAVENLQRSCVWTARVHVAGMVWASVWLVIFLLGAATSPVVTLDRIPAYVSLALLHGLSALMWWWLSSTRAMSRWAR